MTPSGPAPRALALAASLLAACSGSTPGLDAGGGSPDASTPDSGSTDSGNPGMDAGGSDAGGSDSGAPDSGGGFDSGFTWDGGFTVLPIGTVSNVAYAATCPASYGKPTGQLDGGNPDFRCALLTVSCPGIADVPVAVGLVSQPAGTTPKGTIATHNGGTGTAFNGGAMPQAWYADGFNVAEISWGAVWECPLGGTPSTCVVDTSAEATRPGLKEAACRPATVVRWIHDQAQLPDGGPFTVADAGYCGFGSSGGSGAFWYSLLHYGQDAVLDFAELSASTPFSRIDIGCNPAYATSTVPATCQNLSVAAPQVPEQYDSNGNGPMNFLNEMFSLSTCDNGATAADLDFWARDSLISPGANWSETTPVSTYDCVDVAGMTVNLVPAMNTYLFEALWSVDTAHTQFGAQCVVNGTNGTCMGEGVFGDVPTAAAATAEMEARCVAR